MSWPEVQQEGEKDLAWRGLVVRAPQKARAQPGRRHGRQTAAGGTKLAGGCARSGCSVTSRLSRALAKAEVTLAARPGGADLTKGSGL